MLFNVLIGGTLTSLTGQITGTGLKGRMVLRSYDGSAFGLEAIATVVTVPEPATVTLLAVAFAVWVSAQAPGRHGPHLPIHEDRQYRVGPPKAVARGHNARPA